MADVQICEVLNEIFKCHPKNKFHTIVLDKLFYCILGQQNEYLFSVFKFCSARWTGSLT